MDELLEGCQQAIEGALPGSQDHAVPIAVFAPAGGPGRLLGMLVVGHACSILEPLYP